MKQTKRREKGKKKTKKKEEKEENERKERMKRVPGSRTLETGQEEASSKEALMVKLVLLVGLAGSLKRMTEGLLDSLTTDATTPVQSDVT